METVLKGVVRAEKLSNPADFVVPMLERVSKEHIQRQYGINNWSSHMDFLSQLAVNKGKLLKGGEPDCDGVAKIMIFDWQRVSEECSIYLYYKNYVMLRYYIML